MFAFEPTDPGGCVVLLLVGIVSLLALAAGLVEVLA